MAGRPWRMTMASCGAGDGAMKGSGGGRRRRRRLGEKERKSRGRRRAPVAEALAGDWRRHARGELAVSALDRSSSARSRDVRVKGAASPERIHGARAEAGKARSGLSR